jgi:hypothetical protein
MRCSECKEEAIRNSLGNKGLELSRVLNFQDFLPGEEKNSIEAFTDELRVQISRCCDRA